MHDDRLSFQSSDEFKGQKVGRFSQNNLPFKAKKIRFRADANILITTGPFSSMFADKIICSEPRDIFTLWFINFTCWKSLVCLLVLEWHHAEMCVFTSSSGASSDGDCQNDWGLEVMAVGEQAWRPFTRS